MINKIKQKLNQAGNWVKGKFSTFKKWLVVLIIGGTALAIGNDLTTNEVSFKKLQTKYNSAQEIKAKYQLEGTSLKRIANDNPKDRIVVEIGDKDKAEFTPDIQLSRWDEVSFKIKPNLESVATKDKDLKFEGEKIKFNTPKMSFEMYEYTEGEGGYKFIWYLNEKLATNKVEFQIETSGLDFFYQPPLTQEYRNGYSEEFGREIIVSETQVKDLDGNVLVERPENVVGSYAVYHQTKGVMNDINGKEYKTGQFGFIYRPKIIDAEGKETWGILDIDVEKGIYSVEIPQDFLDSVRYPIKSNENFGYETEGSTSGAIIADGTWTNVATPAGNGITDYIKSYLGNNADGNDKSVAALYAGTSLQSPQSSEVLIDTAGSWETHTVAIDIIVQSYNIAILGDSSSINKLLRYYNTGGAGSGNYETATYPNWNNPATWTATTRLYSIYATYTPAGEAPPVQSQVIIIE